jgi:hypothetical protein
LNPKGAIAIESCYDGALNSAQRFTTTVMVGLRLMIVDSEKKSPHYRVSKKRKEKEDEESVEKNGRKRAEVRLEARSTSGAGKERHANTT